MLREMKCDSLPAKGISAKANNQRWGLALKLAGWNTPA